MNFASFTKTYSAKYNCYVIVLAGRGRDELFPAFLFKQSSDKVFLENSITPIGRTNIGSPHKDV